MARSNGVTDIAVYDTDPHRASTAEKRESRPATGPQAWYLYALAAVVVLGFFALTVTMVVKEIPPQSQNIAYMLLGGLVTGFSMVLSYFFGSSAGSAQKTAQIAELAKSGQFAPKQ